MPKRKSDSTLNSKRIHAADQLDALDDALDTCRAVEAISTLLDIAGTSGELQPALAAETGWMIGSRVKKLRQKLTSLREAIAERATRPK
jgi:hypothetical protein